MKKFLAGSAIATLFDAATDELIGTSTTQINDSITLNVESQEVRSGYGAALDYIYYHSSSMEGQLEDSTFNLDYIARNIGTKAVREPGSIYTNLKDKVDIGAQATNFTFDAPDFDQTSTKVWVTYEDKPYTLEASYAAGGKITATLSPDHYDGLRGKSVCVKYLATRSGEEIRKLTVASNFVPAVIKIVLEANLYASSTGVENSSRVGRVQFVIPRAQLTGSQEISMTSTGVASTPLSYMALKADDEIASSCTSAAGVYGYITEIDETKANWYDGVKQLAIAAVGDSLKVAVGDQVLCYAAGSTSTYIIKPTNNLDYAVVDDDEVLSDAIFDEQSYKEATAKVINVDGKIIAVSEGSGPVVDLITGKKLAVRVKGTLVEQGLVDTALLSK